MSNHYTQYLIDNDAEDHEPGLTNHVRDPFMSRHFVDWVSDRVDDANPIDLTPATPAPNIVDVEFTDGFTRRQERILVRVANECGYRLRQIDERRDKLTFSLTEN